MESLEINSNVITPEEQHAMALAAFIGALDNIVLVESTTDYNRASASAGGAITERVLGLFDTASTFYSEDMSRNFELVSSLAGRLAEIAMIEGCLAHNHAQKMFESVSGMYGLGQDDAHNNDNSLFGKHNHDKEDDEYEIDPFTGRKTKKKKQ